MQLSNSPAKIPLPFASSGLRNAIPEASQIGITAGAASLTDGFPPLTRTPLAAGGIPVAPGDMNGILFDLSAIVRWANAGGGYAYDSTFVNDSNVGGYPKGARVMRSDGLGYWFNTTENNTTDPEGAGAIAAGWVPDFTTGVSAVTMTSSNVTLTALQYGKPIIIISGTLTSSLNLIFPNIIGQWEVINNTSGAFSITCKTAAGAGVFVASLLQVVCDGTNIYAANDGASILALNVSAAGGTADALIGLFSSPVRSWNSANGVPFFVRASASNATTIPTVTFNNGVLTPKTIVKGNNIPLSVGDIAGGGHWLFLQYDAVLDKVVLLNPATGVTSAGRLLAVQTFTSSGTYTPTVGATHVVVEVVGGGGGGGGTPATGAGQIATAGGGASGGYTKGYYAASIQTVTIGAAGLGSGASASPGGAGGTTSFGALCVANGGGGGGAGAIITPPNIVGAGGNPGASSATGNIVNAIGSPGGYGLMLAVGNGNSGFGGNSIYGGGGAPVPNAAGVNGGAPGAGASGACAYASVAARSGGTGSAGICIVTEYA